MISYARDTACFFAPARGFLRTRTRGIYDERAGGFLRVRGWVCARDRGIIGARPRSLGFQRPRASRLSRLFLHTCAHGFLGALRFFCALARIFCPLDFFCARCFMHARGFLSARTACLSAHARVDISARTSARSCAQEPERFRASVFERPRSLGAHVSARTFLRAPLCVLRALVLVLCARTFFCARVCE